MGKGFWLIVKIRTPFRRSVSELGHTRGEMGGNSAQMPGGIRSPPAAVVPSAGRRNPLRAFRPCHHRQPRCGRTAIAAPSPAPQPVTGRAGCSRGAIALMASRSAWRDQPLDRGAPSRLPPYAWRARSAALLVKPCPPGDLNPHDLSHWNLNPARLPIPPGGQAPTLGRACPEQSTHNGSRPCRPRPCSPPSGDC